MKVFLILILILSISSAGFAATAQGFYKDPKHPGKCVYGSLILSPGERGKLPNACVRFMCGANSFGTIHTCGSMAPPPGCRFTDYIDINAPMPECCKKNIVC